MDAYSTEDTPLYMQERGVDGKPGYTFLGFYPPEYLRPLISRKEARFQKVHNARGVVLTESAPTALRVRALSSSRATKSLSTVYTEDLYPDSVEQLDHKKKNDIPVTVTHTLVTLKRCVGRGFVSWTDKDGWRNRRRFDPDHIRPQFWSARAAENALRQAETAATS